MFHASTERLLQFRRIRWAAAQSLRALMSPKANQSPVGAPNRAMVS